MYSDGPCGNRSLESQDLDFYGILKLDSNNVSKGGKVMYTVLLLQPTKFTSFHQRPCLLQK